MLLELQEIQFIKKKDIQRRMKNKKQRVMMRKKIINKKKNLVSICQMLKDFLIISQFN